MRKLNKLTSNYNLICFLDFEGTEKTHEMIAFGAVKAKLGRDSRIKKTFPGIKSYVKAKHPIGKYVENLTGIHPKQLKEEGVPFRVALQKIKSYCGKDFEKTLFVTFGNHDLFILASSLDNNMDADKEIVKTISKNFLDFSKLSQSFIRGPSNNPLSLLNLTLMFKLKFEGEQHDPLSDALNLMYLYDEFLVRKDIVLENYLELLSRGLHQPECIKKALLKLCKGQDVSAEEFKEFAREDVK